MVENTQLKATAQEMATVLERNRVARELHDSVTQSLYSIILNSDATLLALASGNPDKVELRLHQLKDIAREAMTELRLLIYELRPSILEEQGLLAALNERLEAVEISLRACKWICSSNATTSFHWTFRTSCFV